jgi:hypothetical protein
MLRSILFDIAFLSFGGALLISTIDVQGGLARISQTVQGKCAGRAEWVACRVRIWPASSVDGEIGHALSSPRAAVLFGSVWQRAIWFVSACSLCQHRVS